MRSPHKSDKAVESQHVPASAAVATRGPIPTPAFGERVVGAAAIALVASLVIQNAVLVWAGAPGFVRKYPSGIAQMTVVTSSG